MAWSPSTKVLLVTAFSVSVLGALSVFLLGEEPGLRGKVQLCLFPVLLALFGLISFKGVRLPRVLLGVAAIGILSGAMMRYGDLGLKPGTYVVAAFRGDPLESRTRIFRDNVRHFLGKDAIARLSVAHASIDSEMAAQSFLRTRETLAGVLWGGEQWINVSLRARAPFSLRSLPPDSVGARYLKEWRIQDLLLVVQPPSFGLSKGIDSATFEFIGRVLHAVEEGPEVLLSGHEASEFEHNLRRAASMKSGWSSMGHIAVPRLTLGTYYLVRAISGSEVEWGDLLCAEAAFRTARAQLNYGASPALKASVLNNEAILRLFKAELVTNPGAWRKQARGALTAALRIKLDPDATSVGDHFWQPIEANAKVIGVGSGERDKGRR